MCAFVCLPHTIARHAAWRDGRSIYILCEHLSCAIRSTTTHCLHIDERTYAEWSLCCERCVCVHCPLSKSIMHTTFLIPKCEKAFSIFLAVLWDGSKPRNIYTYPNPYPKHTYDARNDTQMASIVYIEVQSSSIAARKSARGNIGIEVLVVFSGHPHLPRAMLDRTGLECGWVCV